MLQVRIGDNWHLVWDDSWDFTTESNSVICYMEYKLEWTGQASCRLSTGLEIRPYSLSVMELRKLGGSKCILYLCITPIFKANSTKIKLFLSCKLFGRNIIDTLVFQNATLWEWRNPNLVTIVLDPFLYKWHYLYENCTHSIKIVYLKEVQFCKWNFNDAVTLIYKTINCF